MVAYFSITMTMVIYLMVYDNDIRKEIEILVKRSLAISFIICNITKLLVMPSIINLFIQSMYLKKIARCLFL